jgi:hypothetical protein
MVAAPGITDRNFIKRFKFAKIETSKCFAKSSTSANQSSSATDDSKLGDLNKDMKFIDKVGEITIKFYRCGEATDTTKDATAHDVNTKIASQIHEKALKGQAKSHTTS